MDNRFAPYSSATHWYLWIEFDDEMTPEERARERDMIEQSVACADREWREYEERRLDALTKEKDHARP